MLQKLSVAILLALGVHAVAQPAASEAHASAAFEAARRAGPPALHAFLEKMPKGADLHMHLSGAIYAETFIKNAVDDQLCVDPVQHIFLPNSGFTRSQPPLGICGDGQVPASQLLKNQKLYDAFVDAFSMRAFVPSAGVSGHDQFFATFDRFGLAGRGQGRNGEWLDEVATRAANQNEQYLEVMITPDFSKAIALSSQYGWPVATPAVTTAANSVAPAPTGASREELAALRIKLLPDSRLDTTELARLRDKLVSGDPRNDNEVAAMLRNSKVAELRDKMNAGGLLANEQVSELSGALLAEGLLNNEEFASLREKLIGGGLLDNVALDIRLLDGALADRRRIEHCNQPDAAPACSVDVRIIYQVLRAFPPQQVFAQTLLAFAVAAADPNVVGLNFVQPEDAYMSMTEYHRQMMMLDYLHAVYPQVHISLHAGELAPGMVPPAGERFHIREAVELGHAERIGHGVDVMDEVEPRLLLKELADRHVMVEINLTSNDVILGVDAAHHPLPDYRAAHVPVALATDDEGVSRIDLTHEYVRAAVDFKLSYEEIKQMVRTSVTHAFLPGPSLWQKADDFTRVVPACAAQPLGAESPNAACSAYLKGSPHAAQEWELERRFRVFESTL